MYTLAQRHRCHDHAAVPGAIHLSYQHKGTGHPRQHILRRSLCLAYHVASTIVESGVECHIERIAIFARILYCAIHFRLRIQHNNARRKYVKQC